MDGFLFKWTNYINGWQPRYFVLRDGILSYFASESDVDTGCKGSLKVSACEIAVHQTDACRFEILISGEQRFFLKAANSTERQRWIIALGSCKAGIANMDEWEKTQQTERSIKSKRSELRVNRDLLVQQINTVSNSLKSRTGENQEINEALISLKATCDTFLSNADGLISLLLSSSQCRLSVAAADVKSSPGNAFADNLHNKEPTRYPLLNNHLRALRLARLYPTFLSSMEFSFEDLALPQSANASISAVEFLACCRSALAFLPALANATKSTNPNQLGSLQTVYANVLADIMRLEVAVKSLAVGGEDDSFDSTQLVKQRSLLLSLTDVVDAEIQTNQCKEAGSAYFALLWLGRSFNFGAEFLSLLFKDTTTAFGRKIAGKSFVVETATKAYVKTLKAFHHDSQVETATVVLASLPTAECIQAVLLCPSQMENPITTTPQMEATLQLQMDVERFVEALRRCLVCIHKLLSQRHLDSLFAPVSQATKSYYYY